MLNPRELATWKRLLNKVKESNDVTRKNEVITEAVKHLFNAISADDILHKEKGVWQVAGKQITDAEFMQLKEEANVLRSMKLWRVLKLDIRYQLNKKMFEEARITEDILWGKLILFLDDIIRTRLQSLGKDPGVTKS